MSDKANTVSATHYEALNATTALYTVRNRIGGCLVDSAMASDRVWNDALTHAMDLCVEEIEKIERGEG